MPNCRKVVLHWISGDETKLDPFVENCISDGVIFIGVVGKDCSRIEDVIDEIVVGDGSDDARDILTSSHPDESLESAVAFARSLTGGFAGEVEIVEL